MGYPHGLQPKGVVVMQDSDDFLLTEEVGKLGRAPAETVRYWVRIG